MRKNRIIIFLAGATFLLGSCTDLVVKEKDSLPIKTTTGEFTGIDPAAGLVTSYADLRDFGDQANLYALLEISSDELLCPTRGTDWGDNGVWRSIHQHTWDATHSYMIGTWNIINQHIYRLNQLLDPASGADAQQTAEGKFLRAYNMYLLLDLFRQIPVKGVNDGPDVNPTVMDAATAFDFIAKDLTDALENLPVHGPIPNTNTLHATKAAGNFLLAKLYLNKHIYLGGDPQAADMTKVVQYVDAITNDGFALQSGFFDIFKQTDDTETILWSDTGNGNRMWCGLHYNQPSPDNTGGGWNGFATTAEFYALFEGDASSNEPGHNQEERRGYVPTDGSNLGFGYGFLVGQQYGATGAALKDRAGNPLIFTKDFPGLSGNNEKTGIRVLKYSPANGGFVNHEIVFRYADAYLMKIEAIFRGGSSGDDAKTLYNALRDIRGASQFAGTLTEKAILDERGRELYIEGWRRNDQIRFGTFTASYPLKPNVDDATRNVYPIPSTALASNPNLKQNPGY